jgi:hypothetical protein
MENNSPSPTYIKEHIFSILLNHRHADRTKAAEEIAQLFDMEYAQWEIKLEKAKKLLEENLKLQMRLNMPGISIQEQEARWQDYKKRNNL